MLKQTYTQRLVKWWCKCFTFTSFPEEYAQSSLVPVESHTMATTLCLSFSWIWYLFDWNGGREGGCVYSLTWQMHWCKHYISCMCVIFYQHALWNMYENTYHTLGGTVYRDYGLSPLKNIFHFQFNNSKVNNMWKIGNGVQNCWYTCTYCISEKYTKYYIHIHVHVLVYVPFALWKILSLSVLFRSHMQHSHTAGSEPMWIWQFPSNPAIGEAYHVCSVTQG